MKKNILTLSLVSSLIACGGGGGGSNGGNSDLSSVAAVWKGSATLIENSCNLNLAMNNITTSAQVNQRGNEVTLDDDLGNHFEGSVVENGFVVSGTFLELGMEIGTTCTLSGTTEFVDAIGSNTAATVYRFQGPCVGKAGECRIGFTGSAVRSNSDNPPTASPTTSPSPSAKGACEAITNRSYTGDGGCGISTLSVSPIAGGVVLEPFGINAATTFLSSASDLSSATSVRNDLTLLGVEGYSCSLECFPPLEFKVKCSKEGATSCMEKF